MTRGRPLDKMDKVERQSREIIGNYRRLNDDYKEGLMFDDS